MLLSPLQLRLYVGLLVAIAEVNELSETIKRRFPIVFQRLAPMFLVENVDEAVAWYRDILEAKLQHSLPEIPPFEWASLLPGDIEIMLSQKKAAQQWYSDEVPVSETPANLIAYIYVKHADSLYDRIKGKAKIIMEPIDQSYGIREFAIQDPFGFILIFAQILE